MTAPPQHFRFRPVLFPGHSSGRDRFRIGRRVIYATLAVVLAVDALILLAAPDGPLSWGSRTRGDIVQQVSVTIQDLDPATRTIRVAGDLVGIMGTDVIVTPQTWIGRA
jgi:hypothetical protein